MRRRHSRALARCPARPPARGGGLNTHEIAEALGWDPDAVLLCLAGTPGTLGAGSVPDAVARAIELGLIEPLTA